MGLALCLGSLWLGMRLVMDVGGTCGSGNTPYVIQTQCPDGAGILIAPAVPLGFVFGAMMAFGLAGISKGAGSLLLIVWPALFISLGWNFMAGAINPPGGGGLVVGCLPLAALPASIRAVEERRTAVFSILIGGSIVGVLAARALANAVA